MNRTLIVSFEQLSELAFASRVQEIVSAMGRDVARGFFPEPWSNLGFSLVQLAAEVREYVRVKVEADGGSKMAKARRAVLRAGLSERLKRLAIYLELKAQGNVAMLEATGFALSRVRGPMTRLPPPAPLELLLRQGGLVGSLVLRFRASRTASSYEAQVCDGDPNVEGNWRHYGLVINPRRSVLEGLVSGRLYHVRLRGINHVGPGGWSNAASLRAT